METVPPMSEKQPGERSIFASETERLEYYWKQFTADFPTEQDCVHELYRRVYGHGIKCLKCNSNRIIELANARIIICRDCKKETYTLSGTFFHNIREARRWLAAMWFTDHAIKLNASSFARLVQVVRATADAIFKKISFVVIKRMSDLPEISSREFTGIFVRRSRITPAGEHPRAEQSALEMQHSAVSSDLMLNSETEQRDREECSKTDLQSTLSDREKNVYNILSTEPVHFETLLQRSGLETGALSASLFLLAMERLVRRDMGDWYSLLAPVPSPERSDPLNEQSRFSIDAFIDFVRCTFNGISRKYLQNYLGWYWCIADRKRWKPGSLLDECAGFQKTTLKEILEYVSPLIVKFSPLPAK